MKPGAGHQARAVARAAIAQAEGASLADLVYKDELLGVEVYEWPFGVPRQYTGKQSCGVILFWTKNEGTSP